MLLSELIDDALLLIVEFSAVPEILVLRQTCRRFQDLTLLRSVWVKAFTRYVSDLRLPFPNEPVEGLTTTEIERRTRRALHLKANWTSGHPTPFRVSNFQASSSNIISDVLFVPRHGQEWLITVSKGIWSVIACWDLSREDVPCMIGEWTCKGVLIKDVVVNSDPMNEACLAVSYSLNGLHRIEIQAIKPRVEPTQVVFDTLATLDATHRVVALDGEIVATSNEFYETRITNWSTKHTAILKSSEESEDEAQRDRCLKILFCHESILVGRARSLDLFQSVTLQHPDEELVVHHPIATHSFGWIDSIAVAPFTENSVTHISILLRAESDDPWSSVIHTLNHYVLYANPDYDLPGSKSSVPYIFPPGLVDQIPSSRGFLRCTDLALGRCKTALWIQPRPRGYTGLATQPLEEFQDLSCECLYAAVFLGPLNYPSPNLPVNKAYQVWFNRETSWTSLDYYEGTGRIALGSSDGHVTILEMG